MKALHNIKMLILTDTIINLYRMVLKVIKTIDPEKRVDHRI